MAKTKFMKPGEVREIAQGFDTAADVLKKVGAGLEVALKALTVTSFLSFGATTWLKKYLANIKPKVDSLKKECQELAGDLRKDADNYIDAQNSGNSI